MTEFRIEQLEEATSTNDVVRQAIADGQPEGLAVVARRQTAGYGRRGNRWESEPGSLYMSLLLRPDKPASDLQTMSLMAAIAVRSALASFLPDAERDNVRIKWPNDVVYMAPGDDGASFNKMCGISVEQKQGALCVGIGVNVRTDVHSKPVSAGTSSHTRNRPTYLSDLLPESDMPSVDQVRDRVLEEFGPIYDEWRTCGFEPFRQEFLDHFALEGFKIRIDDTGDAKPIRCQVKDVNPEGHLIVLPEGEPDLREIAAGTITVIA